MYYTFVDYGQYSLHSSSFPVIRCCRYILSGVEILNSNYLEGNKIQRLDFIMVMLLSVVCRGMMLILCSSIAHALQIN